MIKQNHNTAILIPKRQDFSKLAKLVYSSKTSHFRKSASIYTDHTQCTNWEVFSSAPPALHLRHAAGTTSDEANVQLSQSFVLASAAHRIRKDD